MLGRRKEGHLRELVLKGVSESRMGKLGSFLTIVGDLLSPEVGLEVDSQFLPHENPNFDVDMADINTRAIGRNCESRLRGD